ncbi:DMT family transporter [Anaerocolumna sp. AGMB13025]|uniref:DMT family transporter n=1 Tax=Anaerocolumna sp. AGMB13025 TaxID=3039116 RepID=UPI00241DF783|nr:DMT family transporter [Anaerocolumna sp. AGMB13025]WFR55454.1 DMT family transporter [Anaerocolumna sp. AGMB13025]
MNQLTSNNQLKGHITAFFTVVVWGTTFISTKVLLKSFTPVEILFIRFIIGYLALFLMSPHKLKVKDRKHELLFLGAGLSGVTLYFLFENIALTYTYASNVGIVVSVAPIFTALFAHMFLHGEKLKPSFFIGFITAMAGIILISYNGSTVMKLNPLGDILAVLAALVWGVYSVFSKKISDHGYPTITSTRKIFFYGLVFMIPAVFYFKIDIGISQLTKPVNLLNILYLGLGASAVCFATWNLATKLLGAVKCSLYIYFVPVITVVVSSLVLHEKITGVAAFGILLTLLGLILSERNPKSRRWQIPFLSKLSNGNTTNSDLPN